MTHNEIVPGIDIDAAFAAFDMRDRALDGRFVGAVKTTGIYCKPSCPARRPKRENVEFFAEGAAAAAAGYRACLRCRPDDVARDAAAVLAAITAIKASDEPLALAGLAAETAIRRATSSGSSRGTPGYPRRPMPARFGQKERAKP